MKKTPFCSVIVLNYYGEKVVANSLDSLLNLNYPKDKYEIIVVDNNSLDKSREIIESYAERNNNIRPFWLKENRGFSKGNNYGIRQSKADYVVLVNNDCRVDKNWLKELVLTAQRNKGVFAISSKVLLYQRFVNINFKLSPNLIPVYVWLSGTSLFNQSSKGIVYLPFWKKPSPSGGFTDCNFEAYYDPFKDDEIEITLLLNSRGFKLSKNPKDEIAKFGSNAVKISDVKVRGDDIECRIKVDIKDKKLKSSSLDKIQNAGIIVFQDGYARDIGALVRDSTQYYEFDQKQYNEEREIYAACGAAVLYDKKVLDKIGYLDESFFMYYEDVEISERARFHGFKSFYCPKAVVRHFHALSSKEWSPFFTYHVEKGRLMHVFYNFPFTIFLKQYFYFLFLNFAFLIKVILSFRRFFYVVRSRKKSGGESKFQRRLQVIKALLFFVLNLPVLMLKRWRLQIKLSSGVVEANYRKITEGYWYFGK
jgi:GT2 family glycosyltransferase